MKRLLRPLSLVLAFLLFSAPAVFAQTGKVSGTIIDAETGEPLPGVNVVLVEEGEITTMGAQTNAEGFYTILNIAPGTYGVRASFIGYETVTIQDVEVRIGLTSQVPFELQSETVGLEGVTVTAEERVVKADISASRVDVNAEEIENLPVTDIESVIGLQAGVQGLQIRGGEAAEADVRIDGFSMSGGRSNVPYTNFSLTSVQTVQVQSGGFSAKYGNVRSGVVNVVTKDGPRDHYTADVMLQYSPPTSKNFGIAPNDPMAYFMRPYLDPDVAFVGTNEGWKDQPFLNEQYPDFQGFNALAEGYEELTPEQAQALFKFRHRRDLSIQKPDYVIDGGFGGPVPLVSDYLGDLRFYASYRQDQEQYIIPLSRSGYDSYNARLKLTSDITSNMTLSLSGMVGAEEGTAVEYPRLGPLRIQRDGDREAVSGYGEGVSYSLGSDGDDVIFGNGVFSAGRIEHSMIAAKLNHMLGPQTFYELKVQWSRLYSRAYPIAARSLETIETFGGFEADEAPMGFSFEPHNSLTGLRMGAHHSEFRDSSTVSKWNLSFDLTSQVNQYNLVQAGLQLEVSPMDVQYEFIDFLLNPDDIYTGWEETPIYGALYVTDKLEFKGLIANVGLRLDYFDANTEFWEFEPYPDAFLGKYAAVMDTLLQKKPTDAQITLSPRLGVSFPITENSKIYFNYGHFYQQLVPEWLYMVERSQITDGVRRISNPDVPRPKVIAYELGFEQNLFDMFLLRLAGYYKDVRNQPRWVHYFPGGVTSLDYETNFAESYEDTRGIEISLHKNVGEWFTGFANYTYMVESDGEFGYSQQYENVLEEREYRRTTTDYNQFKPLPQPFANVSLTFMTPTDFGPDTGGLHLLGDWRINLTGTWQAGEYFTFTGGEVVPEVIDNMQWDAYKMVDLRIMKNLNVQGLNMLLYADVKNVFNLKNMNQSAFFGTRDYEDYMNSLHLPKEVVEGWEEYYQPKDENGNPIYGNDEPGEIPDSANPPNLRALRYLFPRKVFIGMRVSF